MDAVTPASAGPTDGRNVRRANNRSAVVAALVGLLGEGCYEPSAAEIAGRAGLSPRSLFRYFDDLDDLCRTAIDHILDAAVPLLRVDVPEGASPAERTRAMVEGRAALFEASAPASRAGRAWAHRNPVVAEHMRSARRYLDSQVARVLGPVLGEDGTAVAAACVLLSFESWERLRDDHGLDGAGVEAVWSDALAALSAAAPAPAGPVPAAGWPG